MPSPATRASYSCTCCASIRPAALVDVVVVRVAALAAGSGGGPRLGLLLVGVAPLGLLVTAALAGRAPRAFVGVLFAELVAELAVVVEELAIVFREPRTFGSCFERVEPVADLRDVRLALLRVLRVRELAQVGARDAAHLLILPISNTS